MKNLRFIFIGMFLLLIFFSPSAFAGSCDTATPPPTSSSPGGDHPDETFAVDSGFLLSGDSLFYSDPNGLIFQNGFKDEVLSVFNGLKKSDVQANASSSSLDLNTSTPLLIIPSGGLYGLENSTFFKATLDEYVKNGGTLIVFAQQHGYEFGILPTPYGKPITAYGWQEDQSCFTNAVYIDTWHQMLAGQNRSTPTLNVDGYFTGYPDNSTVILRRNANGQPALLMYDYGQGRVIVTSMYSDWAYGHGQASPEEVALVRDMLTWAKKPAVLPEIKPGEIANVTLTMTNNAAVDAASVKIQVYDPNRTTLISDQLSAVSIQAGQTATTTVSFTAPANAVLGIYHVDYVLLDAAGNIIQPQAETDSGRFVVSNPPTDLKKSPDFNFAVNSDTENFSYGQDATFTITMYNNTDMERTITAKYFFPHHWWETNEEQYGGDWGKAFNLTKTMTIPAKSSVSFTHTLHNARAGIDRLWAYFYDENGKEIGMATRGFYVFRASVGVTATPDKAMYRKGETVNLAVNMGNTQGIASTVNLQVRVTDPLNAAVYNTTQQITLAANEQKSFPLAFTIPATAQGGFYTISAEVFDLTGRKVGGGSSSFELPLAQVSVAPTLSAALTSGNNTISFTMNNTGKVAVANGTLDVTLKDPDGQTVATLSQPFTLNIGESRTIDFPLSIPSLKFGNYTLTYSQSDETKTGKAVNMAIANAVIIANSFDKASYRIRETANLSLNLTNIGKFNLDPSAGSGLTVTVSVPDAEFVETRTITLGQGQALPLHYTIILPETMTVGQHDVNVTLELPSRSSLVQSTKITIPQSFLALGAVGNAHPTAGDTITIPVANSGGVDTPVQYKLSLYDSKSALISEKTATETVPAGASLPLTLSTPSGAVDGAYNLIVNYKDTKTIRTEIKTIPLTVSGVKATLTVNTDKQSYLTTENISSLASLTNSGTPIQDGNLHLQVTTAGGSLKTKTWTSQYDFQQGVRSGVDTYGVNDWLIPDDDFNGAAVDGDRWKSYVYSGGVLPVIVGEQLQLETTGGTFSTSEAASNFHLDGDFDVQVDFEINPFMNENSHALFMAVFDDGSYFRFGRQGGNYQSFKTWPNDNYDNQLTAGSDTKGKFRLTRTGNVGKTWYWNGAGWINHYTWTVSTAPVKIHLHATSYLGTEQLHVKFDNFKVNSGLILTQNETVDSVRLLPLNDNFDDWLYNTDRLSTWGSGGSTTEQNGALYLETPTGILSNQHIITAHHNYWIEGDFDVQVDFSVTDPQSNGWMNAFYIDFNGAEGIKTVYHWFDNRENTRYYRAVYRDPSGTVDVTKDAVVTTDNIGKLRLKRVNNILTWFYWNNSLNRWEWNGNTDGISEVVPTTPGQVRMDSGQLDGFDINLKMKYDNLNIRSQKYSKRGTLKLITDGGSSVGWKNISWSSTQSLSTVIKFRTRTSETKAGLAASNWSDYITASGSTITSPPGRWIEVEATLETTDANVTPVLHDVTVSHGNNPGDVLWQTDVPVSQAQNAISDLNNAVGTIGQAGKLYIQGTLTSSTGQTVATSETPFYVANGNTILLFSPDKKFYKPGETVTISGKVENRATVTASTVNLQLSANSQNIYNSTFDVPANSSHPFTFTTTAWMEGKVTLAGTVSQNGSSLAEISDQYEVANPSLAVSVTGPDVVGNEAFGMDVSLVNTGKTAVNGQLSAVSNIGNIDNQLITVPAGETKVIHYSQQITANTTYTFTLTGDVSQTVTKTVTYGEAATVTFGAGGLGLGTGVYPEGKVAVPVTVTNTGLLDETLSITYSLSSLASSLTKSYFIPKGTSVSDALYYDLAKGSYQLSAVSAQPNVSAQVSFVVAKENDVVMVMNVGTGGNTPTVPVAVSLTNNGWNAIEGSVQLSVISPSTGSGRTVVWSGEQVVSLLTPNTSRLTAFNIDPSAIAPGTYDLAAVLYNNSGQQLAIQNSTFKIQGATFEITQIPAYATFTAGSEGSFTFRIKNTGNQEGQALFRLKVMDVLDQTRSEWLKPGEEKELGFAFPIAEDLEEKDYFGEYVLNPTLTPTLSLRAREEIKGQVKFHVAGVNIGVIASLDKQSYMEGETGRLTLNVSELRTLNSQLNLFARVNYAGYEAKQSFALNGSQTLTFDVPLAKITGEKLFYGIYHESGRSIHLNSIYVYKGGDVLTISTDKQVYNPGEMVTAVVSGQGPVASGEMTLTGPGNYNEVFTFNGSATKYIFLPLTMTAGTYNISGQWSVAGGQLYTATHPIDVNGIQVKVKEAALDKPKYASVDTMNLSLTVESNKDMAATLRTWVVDPSGTYTPVGEQAITLSSTEPLLVTRPSSLVTGVMGIHRLVYGIYADGQPQGTAPTLFVSGSEAFDVGDAVLMGVTTDRSDYPTAAEEVNVTLSMYGSTEATVDLYLDGQPVKNETVSLNGFTTKTFILQPSSLIPGLHSVKVVLSAGGLSSAKETGFTYGGSLPDLTVTVSGQLSSGGILKITAIAVNQGKTASGATDITLYNGEIAIATLPLAALTPGESATVTYDWNVVGKAGVQTVSAVVDAGNLVREFNELNNTSTTSVSIPDVVHNLRTAESAYSSGDIVHIEGFTTNLSSNMMYNQAQATTAVTGPAGSEVFRDVASIDLPPTSVVSTSSIWDTRGMVLGAYVIDQSISYGQKVLASDRKTISLNNTVPSCQVLAPLAGETISGLYPVLWQAQDADGNALAIDIAYSRDGGITWIYEATNRGNDGRYLWDTSSLPDGSGYKVKIIAKDGLAAASCESGAFATINTGALKINSQPEGARVYIDGNYAYPGTYYGVTGINISQIRAGRHILRLTYPGYKDHYQLMEIMPGAETQVMAELKPFVSVSYGSGVKVINRGLPINAGSYSMPVVVDWNMDGMKDLVIGNNNGQVVYYENTGTDNAPLFNLDPVVIFDGGRHISPSIVDWDNDGRADIIAGSVNGEVLLYKNNSQGSLSFEPGALVAKVNSQAVPFVIDWNEDNKKDLVIGGGDGTLSVYINQGTDGQPVFNENPDITIPTGISSIFPFVVTDWDGNGTKDLIVGSFDGGIYVYANQGTNAMPSFGTGQPIYGINTGGNSTPFIVDFNNDGLRDLIAGNVNGDVYLFTASEALVSAVIDLDPDTLNKKSKGQWVTCYIELPAGYNVEDVDVNSLLLEGIIPAETKPVSIGDHDADGVRDLMVKFDRQRLQNLLSKGEKVKITLTGKLKDGRNIRGEDYIRVTE